MYIEVIICIVIVGIVKVIYDLRGFLLVLLNFMRCNVNNNAVMRRRK